MADYSKFVALAQRLIAARGRVVTMRQLGAAMSDPSKPWAGTGTPQVITDVNGVKAVFLPVSGSNLTSVVTDEELLKRVTDVALVAPHEQDLSKMTTIVDGQEKRIEWVQVLKPGDTVCLYVFGMKR